MPKQPNYIALQVQNNTNQTVTATLMGGPINNAAQSNATTLYSFDLSTEVFTGITTITLDYTPVTTGIPISASKPLIDKTIAGVVAALNNINIGQWYYLGTTIYYYSDDYIPTKLTTS